MHVHLCARVPVRPVTASHVDYGLVVVFPAYLTHGYRTALLSSDPAVHGLLQTAPRLAGVSRQEMIQTLNDFLLSLLPLGAKALLIIDEAQNLPRPILEFIRMLSNLETDKEKLLQIVMVGQLNLRDVLRSPELRQLDQRVSIRYELRPLTAEETAAYVAHRLTIAGGGGAVVSFMPKALQSVYKYSAGIPRVINLLCDRALLAAYSERALRVTPDMVRKGAGSLDLAPPRASMFAWLRHQAARLF